MSFRHLLRAATISAASGLTAAGLWILACRAASGPGEAIPVDSLPDAMAWAAAAGLVCGLPGGLYLGLRRRAALDWCLSASLIAAIGGASIPLAAIWKNGIASSLNAGIAVGIVALLAVAIGSRELARSRPPAGVPSGRLILLIVLSIIFVAGGYSDRSLIATGFIGLFAAWILSGHERRLREAETQPIGRCPPMEECGGGTGLLPQTVATRSGEPTGVGSANISP